MAKRKYENNIKESQVEEALVSNLDYLRRLLNLPHPLRLIARQLHLQEGVQRLDLLLATGNEICLVELKVTPFVQANLAQIIAYRTEIRQLQERGLMIQGAIQSFLLVTRHAQRDSELCQESNVSLVTFKPLAVLEDYFRNLSALAPFLQIRPNDYGVFSLGLMNRTLNTLGQGVPLPEQIAAAINLSRQSVNNHLHVAKELGLVRQRGARFSLTDIGDKFVASAAVGALQDELSSGQSEILKQYIANDPFASSIVFGIYAIVESSFHLSRNSYPIELDNLRSMFRTISGKNTEWRASKSVSTATYTFLNYAIDLGLLGKIGTQIVITPSGFRFILMLQLHKSIEMVESLSING